MKIITTIKEILFPAYCILCKAEGNLWCTNCRKSYIFQPVQKCIVCNKESLNGKTHSRCKSKTSIDYFLRYGKYSHDIKQIIHFLKFKHGKELANFLAEHYFQLILNYSEIIEDCVITPIPIHRYRKFERGFNQSEEIAKELTKISGIKTQKLIMRRINTKRQSDLDKEDREKNIKNCFTITSKTKNISSVILIDDVSTTGNTLEEAAKVLKLVGIKKIIAICIARG